MKTIIASVYGVFRPCDRYVESIQLDLSVPEESVNGIPTPPIGRVEMTLTDFNEMIGEPWDKTHGLGDFFDITITPRK